MVSDAAFASHWAQPVTTAPLHSQYHGDPRRVVDIVRASAIFTTMQQLALAIEALLGDACVLIVVRAKDRFNNPTSFGYTDYLLNVRLRDGTHVGELQLHLEAIHAIKPACHRTYALLRQVGWEDLEIENKEADGDSDNSDGEDADDEKDTAQRRSTWGMRWSVSGKDDAAEADPSLELEMTSTSTSTSTNVGQHNPMLSLADATATSTTPIGVTLAEDEIASQVVVEIASTSHGTVAEEQENSLHAAAAAAGALVSTQLVHDKGVSSNTTGGTELNDDDSGRDSTVIGGHEWSTGGLRDRRSSFSVASLGAFARTRPGADGGEVGGASGGASGGPKGRAAKRRSSLDFSWKATVEGFNAGATDSSNAFGGGGRGGVEGEAAEEGRVESIQVVEEAEGQHVWAEHTADDGQTYYHNTVTDETSWTRPEMKNTPTSLVTRDEGSVADRSYEL